MQPERNFRNYSADHDDIQIINDSPKQSDDLITILRESILVHASIHSMFDTVY